MSVYDALLTSAGGYHNDINPPEVSSALGANQNDAHTVHQVAVVIRALTIASQSST